MSMSLKRAPFSLQMDPADISKVASILKSVVLEICQLTVPYMLKLTLHGTIHVEADNISVCSIPFNEYLDKDAVKVGSSNESAVSQEEKDNLL